MLRNCAVGWGGVGMMTFFELEHMVDATQLCLSCHCTHGGCYATVRWGGVGWGGDDDLWENVENPGSWSRVLCNPVNTYGNCMMQSARGQRPGTLLFRHPKPTCRRYWSIRELPRFFLFPTIFVAKAELPTADWHLLATARTARVRALPMLRPRVVEST